MYIRLWIFPVVTGGVVRIEFLPLGNRFGGETQVCIPFRLCLLVSPLTFNAHYLNLTPKPQGLLYAVHIHMWQTWLCILMDRGKSPEIPIQILLCVFGYVSFCRYFTNDLNKQFKKCPSLLLATAAFEWGREWNNPWNGQLRKNTLWHQILQIDELRRNFPQLQLPFTINSVAL